MITIKPSHIAIAAYRGKLAEDASVGVSNGSDPSRADDPECIGQVVG